ncbi:unnamed protein product [Parajaminaea phylloscopi]
MAQSNRANVPLGGTQAQTQAQAQTMRQRTLKQQQDQALSLFSSLLSPIDLLPANACVDLYSLRHLILSRSGLPDSPKWLRPQGWKLLLGFLGSDKKEWPEEERRKREEYYMLLEDLLPEYGNEAGSVASTSAAASPSDSRYDALLTQIHLDLARSRFSNSFAFFLQPVPASTACPLTPMPDGYSEDAAEGEAAGPSGQESARKRLGKGHALRHRLRYLERQARLMEVGPRRDAAGQASMSQKGRKATETPAQKPDGIEPPPIVLSPPSPSTPMPHAGLSLQPPEETASAASSNAASQAGSVAASEDFHSAGEEPYPPPTQSSSRTREEAGPDSDTPSSAVPESDDDRRSNCLLRILFLYSLLNPSIGYVQGMVEVASVALWAEGSATSVPRESLAERDSAAGAENDTPERSASNLATNPHFEADAFWTLSLLLGDLRELWDFEGLDHARAGLRVMNARASDLPSPASGGRRRGEVGGMARALLRLGGRLRWADEELWSQLYRFGLSPSMPYYSFRWLATLLSTSLPLPSVLKIWDAVISANAETHGTSDAASGRVEFLLDILASLLVSHRDSLFAIMAQAAERARREAATILAQSGGVEDDDDDDAGRIVDALIAEESFAACMEFLQDLPDIDVTPVLERAQMLRQRRIAAVLTGEGAPPQDEEEGGEGATSALQQGFLRSVQAGRTALSNLRDWRAGRPAALAQSSPAGDDASAPAKSGWLRSVSASMGHVLAASDSPNGSEATRSHGTRSPSSASSSFLARVQSSDAAAEWSKVSTNWTAKAMDRWNGSARRSVSENASTFPADESSGPPSPTTSTISNFSSRLGSFSSVGASFLRNKTRTFSNSSNTSIGPSPNHPAVMTWNPHARGQMPDFPLPNVMDSPDGRAEYAYVRPASMMYNGNLGGASVGSPLRIGGMRSSPGVSPLSRSSGDDSMTGSPTNERHMRRLQAADEWRFPSQLATAMRSGPSASSASSSSSTRGAGPKPLLLAGSARAAREPSEDGTSSREPPASKVVRTGPLAGSGSPYTARSTGSGTPRRRQGRSSAAGSQSSDGFGADTSSSHGNGSLHGFSQWLTPVHSPERPLSELPTQSSVAEEEELLADSSEVDAITAAAAMARSQRTPGRERQASHSSDATPQYQQPLDRTHRTEGPAPVGALPSSTSLQRALQTAGTVPDLPSLRGASATSFSVASGRRLAEDKDGDSPPVPLKRSDAGAADAGTGTISAGAFGGSSKNRAPEIANVAPQLPTSDDDDHHSHRRVESQDNRPHFGSIASSSDVPLISNEGRQVRRRALPGGASSSGNERRPSRYSHRQKTSSVATATVASGSPLVASTDAFAGNVEPKLTDEPSMIQEDSVIIHPEDRDGGDAGDAESNGGAVQQQQQRYTLTDEPVALVEGLQRANGNRSTSSSFAGGVASPRSTSPGGSPDCASATKSLASPTVPPPPPPPAVSHKSSNVHRSAAVRASSSSIHSVGSSSGGASAASSSRSGQRAGAVTGADRGIVRSKRSFKTGSTYGVAPNARSSSRASSGAAVGAKLDRLDTTAVSNGASSVTMTASPTAVSPTSEHATHQQHLDYFAPPTAPTSVPVSAARMDADDVHAEDGVGFGLAASRHRGNDGSPQPALPETTATANGGRPGSVAEDDGEHYYNYALYAAAGETDGDGDGADAEHRRGDSRADYLPPVPTHYGASLYDGGHDPAGGEDKGDDYDDGAMAAIGSAFERFSANAASQSSDEGEEERHADAPIDDYGADDGDGEGEGQADWRDRYGQEGGTVNRSSKDEGHSGVIRDKAGGIKF